VLAASISGPDDEGSKTSETPVNFYHITRRYNPEDSHLHTRRRENLQSYLVKCCVFLAARTEFLNII
jgi:hypothetical protein